MRDISDVPIDTPVPPSISPDPAVLLPASTPIGIPNLSCVPSVLGPKTIRECLEEARGKLEDEMRNLAKIRMQLVEANDSLYRSMLVLRNLRRTVLEM
jgi:hypothetical protein